MTRTAQTILLILATLAFAAGAGAEEVFIHFEELQPGDDVAGLGTLHPNLDIQPLNFFGDLRTVQTFYTGDDAELTIYRAPNRNAWDAFHTNNGLEDARGEMVMADLAPCFDDPSGADCFDPGEARANGFANTSCSWTGWDDEYYCPQEFRIRFNNRRVYKFKMLMVDYGDWNPTLSEDHRLELRGFDDGVEIGVSYTIEYTTDPVRAPQWCSLGFNPKIESDAFDSHGSGLGHQYLVINAPPSSNGFDEIQLWASDPDLAIVDPIEACASGGCDPNAAFDSLRIGYVNLVDIHPVSCPNPLNLGGGGVLPAAVLGTAEFDVSEVQPDTCRLAGVPVARWSYDDVSRPYVGELVDQNSCTSAGPDGYGDLTLKFSNRDVAAAVGSLPHGATVHLDLICLLANGDEFRSEDVMKVINN